MDRQSSHRSMGALRSTGLLENRHHACCCDRPETRCDFYRPQWMNGPDYALLTAYGDVETDADGVFRFSERCGCGGTNEALLTMPGMYYAAYTLRMPKGAEIATDIALHLEERMLPESRVHAESDGQREAHICGHAVFAVQNACRLRLRARQSTRLCGADQTPMVTLAVFRIG